LGDPEVIQHDEIRAAPQGRADHSPAEQLGRSSDGAGPLESSARGASTGSRSAVVELELAGLWLKNLPGYRELIRQRLSESQQRTRKADSIRDRGYQARAELQALRESYGCSRSVL
jgi:hypothetical protein